MTNGDTVAIEPQRQLKAQALGGQSGDVRGIGNPQDGETSMLLGDRRGRTPKMEGGAGRARAPLCVYASLIFSFLIFGGMARAADPRTQPQPASSVMWVAPLDVAELVARACPHVILSRGDSTTLSELVRECDRQLEHLDAPARACDPELDGLCVK